MIKESIKLLLTLPLLFTSFLSFAADEKTVLFGHYIGENISKDMKDTSKYLLIYGNPVEQNYIDNDFKSTFFSQLIVNTDKDNLVNKIKAISYPSNFYNTENQCFDKLKEKAMPLKNYYREEDTDNASSFVFGDSISFMKSLLSEDNEKNIVEKISNLLNGNLISLKCEKQFSPFYKKEVYFISYELSNIKTLLKPSNKHSAMNNNINELFGVSLNNDGFTGISGLSYTEDAFKYRFKPKNSYQNISDYFLISDPATGNISEIRGSSRPIDKETCFNLLKTGEQQISSNYNADIYSRSDLDYNEIVYTVFDDSNKSNLNVSCERKKEDVKYTYSIYIKKNLL